MTDLRPQPERSPCLTVQQVAAHFAVSRQTVYNWIRSGTLGHLRTPGGIVRVRHEDVAAFEARCWQAPAAAVETNPRPNVRDAFASGRASARRRHWEAEHDRASPHQAGRSSP